MRGVFLSQVSCAKAEMDDHKPLVNFDSFLMAPQPRPALKPSLAPLCTQEQSQTLPGPPASSTTKLLEFGSLLFLCVALQASNQGTWAGFLFFHNSQGSGGLDCCSCSSPCKALCTSLHSLLVRLVLSQFFSGPPPSPGSHDTGRPLALAAIVFCLWLCVCRTSLHQAANTVLGSPL